ncbi:hypothetical protein TrLO_g13334 [Triparma laevis f. longispina]|uniref:Heme oxygenase n=1 Tax=Triparma laevis f. longispina TaxID=1714387 RepID=A0A9W7FHM1_9STRA|nr:hypothetical protein TrLO_g13334 [Triparma laevis f. longispina]
MGSFAKVLSQFTNVASARLSAPGASSTSSRGILQTSRANKTGLSLRLDATLKDGHDMKTFGLGTAASLASRGRYARFTSSMFKVYSVMEKELDDSCSPSVRLVWDEFGDNLRRAEALKKDLRDVADNSGNIGVSTATNDYVNAIISAASKDQDDNGARLIGHLYCRYFADLMGGQILATPTRYALNLSYDAPRHYYFGDFAGENRGRNVERLYARFNEAGEIIDDDGIEEVIQETYAAFDHNINVYKEEGRLWEDSAIGVRNIILGYLKSS